MRVIIVFLAIILGVFWTSHAAAQQSFSLKAHQDFGLSLEDAWTVHFVGSDISIERPGKKVKTRRLSGKQMSMLLQSLKESDFAGLHPRYGCPGVCFDFPTCSLELRTGLTSQRVVVFQGDPPVAAEAPDVRRFMSVWKLVKQYSRLNHLKDACP